MFESVHEPGRSTSLALAVAVHLAFFVFLYFGIHWQRKPLLQRVYRDFYRTIARRLTDRAEGLTVEIGAGIGSLKTLIPECIATDLFPNPWLDQVENAYALTFPDGSVGNLILFDVWHHLQYPGTVLREFPLRDGSALLLAIGLWRTPGGRPIWNLGIEPDVAVALPADAMLVLPDESAPLTPDRFAVSTDAQLRRAWQEVVKAAKG